MRRGLIWVLGATVLASAAAMMLERQTTTVVNAIEVTRSLPSVVADADVVLARPATSVLPTSLERWPVEPATRDPLWGHTVGALPQTLPRAPVAPAAPAGPPQAPPPAMEWRYLGAIETPDGHRVNMLTSQAADQAVVAEPGARLAGGYEILSIDAEAIVLVYPPLQLKAVIPIPPPPAADR
jgi:hypothetical protein